MADTGTADVIDVAAVLAPGGAVAAQLGDAYEPRPQQSEMAAAVGDVMAQGGTLLVEAGTGVGTPLAEEEEEEEGAPPAPPRGWRMLP